MTWTINPNLMTSFWKRNNNALVVLLVLLNLVVLTLLLWPKPPIADGPATPNPRMHQLFKDKLNLDPEQAAAFETALRRHREQSRPLLENLQTLKQELITSMSGLQPDTLLTEQLVQQIAAQHAMINAVLVAHYRELRAICTPEQQVELEVIFKRSFDRRKNRRKSKKR